MNCPYCKTTFDASNIAGHDFASDVSFVTATAVCPRCEKDLELYFPLKEIEHIPID